MAIQFCCPRCGQPIEVDDEHAGKAATCPYCHKVVAVPRMSTYRPEGKVSARPAVVVGLEQGAPATSGPTPTEGVTAAPSPVAWAARQRAAVTYGNCALACAAIAVLLFLGVFGYGFYIGVSQAARGGPPSSFDKMTQEIRDLPGSAWMRAAQCGALFFALVGLPLAIVSLVQSRAGNWRGWLSLCLCAGLLVCLGGLIILGAILLGRAAGSS